MSAATGFDAVGFVTSLGQELGKGAIRIGEAAANAAIQKGIGGSPIVAAAPPGPAAAAQAPAQAAPPPASNKSEPAPSGWGWRPLVIGGVVVGVCLVIGGIVVAVKWFTKGKGK